MARLPERIPSITSRCFSGAQRRRFLIIGQRVAGFSAASRASTFSASSIAQLPQFEGGHGSGAETHAVCEAAICYTGDILDRAAIPLVLCEAGPGWKMGALSRHQDMAGCAVRGRAPSESGRRLAFNPFSYARYSGARGRCWPRCRRDVAIWRWDVRSTSQPNEFDRGLDCSTRGTGLDLRA
jgi:hypothetical protein